MKNRLPAFFITGTSGSGKSTLTELLKTKLSKTSFEVHDFDEHGVPAGADQAWRKRTTKAWLVRAQANAAQGKATIICGVSVPSEVLEQNQELDLMIYFGYIKINDDLIRQRLQSRGWHEQLIQDNINWAHFLEREVNQQQDHLIVDGSASTPQQVGDNFVTWIQKLSLK